MARWCWPLLLCGLPSVASAQTLPRVADVEWPALREHLLQLLPALEEKAALPAETLRRMRTRLAVKSPDNPESAVQEAQDLLDAHCLVGVSINPESRVKAARGPAVVQLRQDRETFVLIKVQNEAGVTHALTVSGPQLVAEGKPQGSPPAGKSLEGRWLRASVAAPLGRKLNGQRLEYVLVKLKPLEAGKREATFKFDVGQGTQDLGFRAEVPILFTVRAP